MITERLKRGILQVIVGTILAVFGWADLEYYLTELPIVIDNLLLYVGGLLVLYGIGYIILGIIRKSPTSSPPVQPQPTPEQIWRKQKDHSSTTSDLIYCTKCGQQMDKDVTFCPNCGNRR